jgi:6-phosphogluconolactonase
MQRFFRLSGAEYPEVDLIVLGIGEDGHTASLFPRESSFKETRAFAAAAMLDAKRHHRITVTLPVINNAKNVIVLVSGDKKASAGKKGSRRESEFVACISGYAAERESALSVGH